jgi:hypothetical protein
LGCIQGVKVAFHGAEALGGLALPILNLLSQMGNFSFALVVAVAVVLGQGLRQLA